MPCTWCLILLKKITQKLKIAQSPSLPNDFQSTALTNPGILSGRMPTPEGRCATFLFGKISAEKSMKVRETGLHVFGKFLFLPSATKLWRLCFYTCLSVHKRGSASVHAGIPPPRVDIPQEQVAPREQTPPGAGTPPPPADGYSCRRYASYWNAFFLG